MSFNLRSIFGIFIFFELLSFLGDFLPFFNYFGFFIVLVSLFYFSYKKLSNGLLIVLVELFLNAKGHIFFLPLGDFRFSIRMALWVSVLLIWFLREIYDIKKGKFKKIYLKQESRKLFIIFFAFALSLGVSVFLSFLNNIQVKNLFLDFNAWLYLFLFFPFFYVYRDNNDNNFIFYNKIKKIFFYVTLFITVKTLFLFFIFTHYFPYFSSQIYHWLRFNGIAEVTRLSSGFSRIFLQNQIFIFFSFFFIWWQAIFKETKKDFCLLGIFATTIILSGSRSNWLSFILVIILALIFIFHKLGGRKFLKAVFAFFVSFLFAYIFLFLITIFPYPGQGNQTAFSLKDVTARAMQVNSEAAVSSRWSLLPVMRDAILKKPILGYGFGKTLQYKSSDPRVLELNPDGEYSTYAFEWGWLDIILKMGLSGFFIFVSFILFIIYFFFVQSKRNIENDYIPIILSLVMLSAVHFFSPYLNHPLGIGFMLISIFYFISLNNEEKSI